jgi:uncharacterized protein YdaU (DUF1376 family)
MHYYQFNIGDYASHTRGLSLTEDLAYRRLLDEYYLHERPFNSSITSVARQIGMKDYEDDVKFVLDSFFTLTDIGWINSRADKEIKHFHSKIMQASRAGKASAERRSNKSSTDVQPTNNQQPITNNHSKTQRGTRLPTDFEMPNSWGEWCQQERPDLVPRKVFDSFKDFWISKPGAGGVKLNWDATWRNWVRSQKHTFVKPQDVVHMTVPTPPNHDAALRKIEEDRKRAVKPNSEVQAKIAELLKGRS